MIEEVHEGSDFYDANKEIDNIKQGKWTCTISMFHKYMPWKCIKTSVCCVNCSELDTCRNPCPRSDDWTISNQNCEFVVEVKNAGKNI